MPIIGPTDYKSARGRFLIVGIYVLLTLGAVAMVCPFLVMLTGSVSNPFDYERRSLLPRFLMSREDRLMRLLALVFPPQPRNSVQQMKSFFPDCPEDWQIWAAIGDERAQSDAWARKQLRELADPARRADLRAAARDYTEFIDGWDLRETTVSYNIQYIGLFLKDRYRTLDRFNAAWELSVDDFMKIAASEWSGEAFDLPSFTPLEDARYQDLLAFRQAYRQNRYSSCFVGAPANLLRPAALRFTWESYVRAAGDEGKALGEVSALPFPVPADAPAPLRTLWQAYLLNSFALRHVAFPVTAERTAAFRAFLVDRFRTPAYAGRVLERPVQTWDDLPLTPTVPDEKFSGVWFDFLRTAVPVQDWQIRDTLPELAFQKFALRKHGDRAGVNAAYGLQLAGIEQLHIPYRQALLTTFADREWSITLQDALGNYGAVFDHLFLRGPAVRNTLILVALAITITLTVNPLCAYALSRFRLRPTEKIIVFCLTTMAFPAAVSAIPGFLLLRDLNLLNTFAALVLPGAANGMTIFLLKGFFDSLPQELFEAATIDGASEIQVFYLVSLPLVKPILAVSMLNAFISAYAGWEWALIVCQDQRMWTVSVWTYQFSSTFATQPYVVMAAYAITSVPVLLEFLLCQKVILRGIILPQMK
jgi:multiple sugar transport system permease protein